MPAMTRKNPPADLSFSDFAVEDSEFALAIVVLSKRISRLCKEDQDDLYELLPYLLGGDDEERESAVSAVKEILDQEHATVTRSRLEESPASDELQKWIDHASNRLRVARRDADMTQDELAEASGIPQSYISRLERGQHSPTSKTLETLAKALNVPLSTFDPSAE